MTVTAFSPANSVTTTTADKFIPEIWSDEIIAAYKKNLVLANIVMKMNFKGKKGDTIHIPSPTRGSASAKATTVAVTLIAATETEVQVSINKHYEYSRMIEDIVEAQALNTLRNFYTSDAGYALAKQVDTDLIQLGRANLDLLNMHQELFVEVASQVQFCFGRCRLKPNQREYKYSLGTNKSSFHL